MGALFRRDNRKKTKTNSNSINNNNKNDNNKNDDYFFSISGDSKQVKIVPQQKG